nr:MAG TPA: hypothetical protein [Caudoviricetes sp.]
MFLTLNREIIGPPPSYYTIYEFSHQIITPNHGCFIYSG